MATIYATTIAAVPVKIAPGWSIDATANGRNVMRCRVTSVDGTYRPAEGAELLHLEGVTILTSSVANPTVFTTQDPHGIVSGQTVTIANHIGSTPAISSTYTATRLSPTTFSIPVNVTVGGTGGTAYLRIFAGQIDEPDEGGIGGLSQGAGIATEVNGIDYNARVERRYVDVVLVAGTLKSMLTTLATRYGFTVHPNQVNGPVLDAQTIAWTLMRDVLDRLAVVSGYLWENDEYDRLRMFAPGSEVAPFDIVTGDGNAIGDIRVRPTRNNYANRVILLYTALGTAAYGFMAATANFANGETVTIGTQVYTFQTTLTNVAGNVQRGATTADSLANLIAAVSLGQGTPITVNTLTRSGTTATATTASAHGRTTGDTVIIAGAVEAAYNHAFVITVTGTSTFTFTVSGSPTTPATPAPTITETPATGAGTQYAAATGLNGSARAYLDDGGRFKAVALSVGAAGNQITVATTGVNALWYGEGATPITQLQLGADDSLTNVAIAEDVAAQAPPMGIYEVLIQSPETTKGSSAQLLASSYLDAHSTIPKVVTYVTRRLGLRPGQTQAINIAKRHTTSTYLITDVSTTHVTGALVERRVTAIESTSLASVRRWQAVWRQFGSGASVGGSSGAAMSVASGGGVVSGALPPLPNGQIFVGSSGNNAVAVAMTGDVTMSNTGVTAIGASKVTSAMIVDGAIVNADINASAAVVYAKLNLSNGIVNADINTNAAVAYSKLNLSNSIVNGDVNTNAAIVDTKLATIATPLKVSNSATTATSANTPSAIVARDASGNFIATRPTFTSVTTPVATDLTIDPTGNLITDPVGNNVLPSTNYDINIGMLSKKYLALHAAELWVETLVAQNTIATIGGRVLVAPTNILSADLAPATTTITVKYNNFANGDRVYMEANGSVEFFAITSSAGGSAGAYTYTVTRNLDGTGANQWYAGDAMLNTGTTGNGFIDIYSVRGVKAGTEIGPTIVGNVRNSATFNDWSPRWAIGNLDGLYGYSGSTYGAAFGVPTGAWIKIDPTNGVRIGFNATTYTQIDASGNASFSGTVTATAGAIGGFAIGADYIRDAANSFGLASTVTGGDDIRFWAGDTFANRGAAPFRLTETGVLTASNANITGALSSTSLVVASPGALSMTIVESSGVPPQGEIKFTSSGTRSTTITSQSGTMWITGGSGTTTGLRVQSNGLLSTVDLVVGTSGGIERFKVFQGSGNTYAAGTLEWGGGAAIPSSTNVARRDTANTFASDVYVAGRIEAMSAAPLLQTNLTTGATDEKYTRWISGAGYYGLELVNDAYSAATTVMYTTRSGLSVGVVARGNNAATWDVVSDVHVKTRITDYRATARMRQVKIHAFDYTEESGIAAASGIGPIAQDIQAIFPDSVRPITREGQTLLTFNASALWMANVAYTQEIDTHVEALAARVAALEREKR